MAIPFSGLMTEGKKIAQNIANNARESDLGKQTFEVLQNIQKNVKKAAANAYIGIGTRTGRIKTKTYTNTRVLDDDEIPSWAKENIEQKKAAREKESFKNEPLEQNLESTSAPTSVQETAIQQAEKTKTFEKQGAEDIPAPSKTKKSSKQSGVKITEKNQAMFDDLKENLDGEYKDIVSNLETRLSNGEFTNTNIKPILNNMEKDPVVIQAKKARNEAEKKAKFDMQGRDQIDEVSELMKKYRTISNSNLIDNGRRYHVGEASNTMERYINEAKAANGNTGEIRKIKEKYGIEDDAAKHFKELAKKAPDYSDYMWGYKAPQRAAGALIAWGAVSSVFSNKGRRSNAELYGSPF